VNDENGPSPGGQEPSPAGPPGPRGGPTENPNGPPSQQDDPGGDGEKPVSDDFQGDDEQRATEEEAARRVRAGYGDRSARKDYFEFHSATTVYRADKIYLGPGSTRGLHQVGPLTPAALSRLRSTFVETATSRLLVQQLRESRLQILTGKPGSGRLTSALHALDLCTETGCDRVFVLDPVTSPGELDADRLKPGCGYVLKLTAEHDMLNSAVFGSLRNEVTGRDAYLVIITVLARDPRHFVGHITEQSCPELAEVFDKHLAYLAGTHALSDGDRILMTRQLSGLACPRYAVELAESLAGELPAGHEPREILVSYWSRIARQEFHRADNLARRCFLLACAVLDGLPSGDVARAGFDLDSRLQRTEKPRRHPSRKVFDQELSGWWSDFVVIRHGPDPVNDADLAATSADRLVIRNGTLAPALLALAWQEHPAAQVKLLGWLHDLALDANLVRRAKVAWAVGTLATLDFETVYREVLGKWLARPYLGLHKAVAWSLDQASASPRLSSSVRQRVDEWSRSGKTAFRIAAATAYGDRVAGISVREALDGLRRIARYLAQVSAVCSALAQISADGNIADVVVELARWVGSGEGLRRAARESVVWLAYLPDPAAGLLLLNSVTRDEVPRTAVIIAWRAALESKDTADRATRALVRWLEEANQRPGVRSELCKFIADVAPLGAARDRLHLHAAVRSIRDRKPAALAILQEELNADAN
jgi:hypothetical protein